jgi:hypothetical protein
MPGPDLSSALMAAARRLHERRRGFTADDLMAEPEVAGAFHSKARVCSQAQYLADCGWLEVIAAHPVPTWAVHPRMRETP